MNQSKTITLDAVLREAILRDIKPTQTPNNKIDITTEISLDTVLREAFRKDIQLNEQTLGSSAFINNPDYDYASMFPTWNKTSHATPWKNKAVVNTLLSLGAKAFPAMPTGEAPASPVTVNQAVSGEGKPTGIGYQLSMYAQKLKGGQQIGTYVYFWENGKMTIAGNSDKYWNYKLSGGKIAITYPDGFMKLQSVGINVIEGYLIKSPTRQGEVIFKDTNPDDPFGLRKKQKKAGILSPEVEEYLRTHSASNFNWLKANKPTYWSGVLDRLQTVLDFTGIIIPPADALNVVISIARGYYFEAIISVIGLIPGVGDAIAIVGRTIAKTARKIGEGALASFTQLWSKLLKSGVVKPTSAKQILQKASDVILQMAKKANLDSSTIQKLKDILETGRKSLDAIIEKRIKNSKLAQQIKKRADLRKSLGIDDVSKAVDGATDISMKKTNAIVDNMLQKIAFPKSRKFLTNLVTASTRRSSAVFEDIFQKMQKGFAKKLRSPRDLGATILSFGDTKLRNEIVQNLFEKNRDAFVELAKKAPGLVDPKDAKRLFNSKPSAGLRTAKQEMDDLANNMSGININELPTLLNLLRNNVPDAFDDLGDEVAKKLFKTNTPNYYWDAYKTSPIREFYLTNVKPRGMSTIVPKWMGGKSKFSDMVTSSNFYKKLDIAYNEIREYNEIKAGQGGENISKQSLLAWGLWKTGWITQSDNALLNLENMPNVARILSRPDPAYHLPEYPGSLDTTAFQMPLIVDPTDPRYQDWIKNPANARAVRYDTAQRKRKADIEKAKKKIYKQ